MVSGADNVVRQMFFLKILTKCGVRTLIPLNLSADRIYIKENNTVMSETNSIPIVLLSSGEGRQHPQSLSSDCRNTMPDGLDIQCIHHYTVVDNVSQGCETDVLLQSDHGCFVRV